MNLSDVGLVLVYMSTFLSEGAMSYLAWLRIVFERVSLSSHSFNREVALKSSH